MAALTSLMHSQAYTTSAELAAAVGPAPAYQRNSDATEQVIRNHARAAHGSLLAATDLGPYEALHVHPVPLDHAALADTTFAALSPLVRTTADLMVTSGSSGRRNMQVSALAPTGTIGLQMGCATTGIEPDFALVKFKKLAGGGVMKIVNGSVPAALRRLGYSPETISAILTHALGTASLDGTTPVNRASLQAHGLSTEAISRVAAELPRAMTITQAFAPHTVGLADLLALGIEAEHLDSPTFDLLTHLGYTPSQIAASTQVICGHHTVEGTPGLDPAHLAVFDTASYCGDGTRVITPSGHVRALGAVAPFLSGSTSKTVNLPNQASVAEIREAFELAYALAVKCVAVYRDGSKHSQVLSSQTPTAPLENEDLRRRIEDMEPGISPVAFYHGSAPPKFRLPNQRFGPTWKISVGGTELFLHVGEYPDGTAGEIFCDILKEGSTLSGILKVFCIAVSHGLQYGVPLAKLVDAFTFHSFPPAGIVSGDPNLKMASSIIDAIFKLLGYHYLGDESLVQVTTPPPSRINVTQIRPIPTLTTTHDTPTPPTTLFESSGNICDNCGGVMVRSGTCSRCLNCGDTSGCS
jgi:ribonucleoside-diphosphate reductase alpha chain